MTHAAGCTCFACCARRDGYGPRWGVLHPGIGLLYYDSEEEAHLAAGTAGTIFPPVGSTRCFHAEPALVHNAQRVPVRLVCSCGEEWRVVPVDALVTLNPAVRERRKT